MKHVSYRVFTCNMFTSMVPCSHVYRFILYMYMLACVHVLRPGPSKLRAHLKQDKTSVANRKATPSSTQTAIYEHLGQKNVNRHENP